jgi:hypothetical protein
MDQASKPHPGYVTTAAVDTLNVPDGLAVLYAVNESIKRRRKNEKTGSDETFVPLGFATMFYGTKLEI